MDPCKSNRNLVNEKKKIAKSDKMVNWELIERIEARMVEIDLVLEVIGKMENKSNTYYIGNTKLREREV